MGNVTGQVVTVLTAIIGVAMLAVLVSRNSQTPQVVKAFGDAFGGSIKAAVSPIMGGGMGGSGMLTSYQV